MLFTCANHKVGSLPTSSCNLYFTSCSRIFFLAPWSYLEFSSAPWSFLTFMGLLVPGLSFVCSLLLYLFHVLLFAPLCQIGLAPCSRITRNRGCLIVIYEYPWFVRKPQRLTFFRNLIRFSGIEFDPSGFNLNLQGQTQHLRAKLKSWWIKLNFWKASCISEKSKPLWLCS